MGIAAQPWSAPVGTPLSEFDVERAVSFILDVDRWPRSRFAHRVGRCLLVHHFNCDAATLLPRKRATLRVQPIARHPRLADLDLRASTLYDFIRVYMQGAGLPTRSRSTVLQLSLSAQIQLLDIAAPEEKGRLAGLALSQRWTTAHLSEAVEQSQSRRGVHTGLANSVGPSVDTSHWIAGLMKTIEDTTDSERASLGKALCELGEQLKQSGQP